MENEMTVLTEDERSHRDFLRREVDYAYRKLGEARSALARFEAGVVAMRAVPAGKVAVVASLDGIDRTLSVHDKLADARLHIKSLRRNETHNTEGNGFTGASFRLMRGTSALDWKLCV